MEEIKISIIIPIYNVELYIKQCLESVERQTETYGIECLLIDDRGQDKSFQVANDFVENYNLSHIENTGISFRIISHDKNRGLSEARNTGIREARGKYIYFLDSDDTITPDCMQEMLRLIDKYRGVDMVIGNNDISDILCIPFGEYTEDPELIIKNLLFFNGRAVAAQRHMIRKDIIINNHLSFYSGIIHEDNLWTFMLSKFIKSIAFSTKDLYNYSTDNQNSIMRSKKIDKEVKAYRTIIKNCCANIYSYKKGIQKEYILSNLQIAINSHYYTNEEDRISLIYSFADICTLPEKILLKSYFVCRNKFVKRVSLSLLHKLFCLNG